MTLKELSIANHKIVDIKYEPLIWKGFKLRSTNIPCCMDMIYLHITHTK